MEHNSAETGTPDSSDEEELTATNSVDLVSLCKYSQQNQNSTNVQLFSFLALLNAYVPESYLRMHECQQVLGPPDPIHGGPPFEDRMMPFTDIINTSNPDKIHITNPEIAQIFIDKLAYLTRSTLAKKLMFSLCGNLPESYIIQFIRDLLVKREMGEKGLEKFSALITDILEKENFYNAFSVLKTASMKFRQNSSFPQTVSRLYYIHRSWYDRAEKWAKIAISRAPTSSYMADTLGQVYKHLLFRTAWKQSDVIRMAQTAFKAFKDVEKKAEREEGPQKEGVEDVARHSGSFNNRGLFGFIQIAKIAFEKLDGILYATLHPNLTMEVEDKFTFFEWYLTYSKINMTTTEPDYFWKDVALCYQYYTTKIASKSTSFPGLLDCLNHGLFTSREKRAGLESEKTESDLETIQDDLKSDYMENTGDVRVAERYVLSNILLSNKKPDSPQLTPVTELQAILHRFLGTEVERQRSEFCLLVLLLFWPKEQPEVGQEEDDEVNLDVTADDWSEIPEDEDTGEENVPEGESAQQSSEIMFDPDMEQYVTLMESAFERAKYAKYLRGRYLLTLFFLGKGSGLSRWIHKSRLDAIVEKKVDRELANQQHGKDKKTRISDIWCKGEVWHIPQIKDILLPVRVEQEVVVCAGGKRIKARVEAKAGSSGLSPMLYYLGFTIQGPVVFKVETPQDGQ